VAENLKKSMGACMMQKMGGFKELMGSMPNAK